MICPRCIRHALKPIVRMVLKGLGLSGSRYICPVCGYVEGENPLAPPEGTD
jgi:hypothetical protein